ncbi:MAG: 3-keto-disaccharide hydrolase [Akkermansiaceae bacterium]
MKLYSIATSLLLSISAVIADDKATPIFNGKDLAGWSVKSKEAEKAKAEGYWSVVDGAIQVETKGDTDHDYVWLSYDQELGDFELTLKTRTIRFTKGNSGIQVRSRYHAKRGGVRKLSRV